MVKTINKINKNKYQPKNNTTVYLVAGVAIAVVIAIAVYLSMGSGASSGLVGPAPSGTNCPENIAYLQSGVDKYQEMTGQFPTELSQLTQTAGDKGSIIEKLVYCPSGNIYVIENGKVIEAAPK